MRRFKKSEGIIKKSQAQFKKGAHLIKNSENQIEITLSTF